MSIYRILLSSWGDPFSWGPVNYHVVDHDNSCNNLYSTTQCLSKILKPDLNIITVPETVMCRRKGGCVLDYMVLGRDPYPDIIDRLEKSIRELIGEWGFEGEPDIVVTPSIGEYVCGNGLRVRWELGDQRSDPVSLYAGYILLYTFLRTISDNRIADRDEIEVVLDTSHGINYMPVALYRATMIYARLLSTYYSKKTFYRQYNSTPYIPGARDLEIYIVRREVIEPNKAVQRLVYSYLAGIKDGFKPIKMSRKYVERSMESSGFAVKDIPSELKILHSSIRRIASSIHYSMPLAFIHYSYFIIEEFKNTVPRLNDLSGILEKVLKQVLIDKISDKEYRVSRKILVEYDQVKSLLASIGLAKYGLDTLKQYSIDNNYASLNTLKEILEKRLRGPLYNVASEEISHYKEPETTRIKDIKNLVSRTREKPGKWIQLPDKPRINVRTLIAHSGLNYSILEAMYRDEKLYLRYRKDALKELNNMIDNALKELEKLVNPR